MRSWPFGAAGPVLGGPVPLVAAPIVAATPEAALVQAATLRGLPNPPDLVELRADHLPVARAELPALLHALRLALTADGAAIPILFTQRRSDEGGAGAWDEAERLARITAAIASGAVAAVDIELATTPADRDQIIQRAHAAGVGVIVSAHDFTGTPADATLASLLLALCATDADLAKLAVTAQSPDDALRLLRVTAHVAMSAPVPLATMAMGSLGAITRLAGPHYGSALTFAAAGGIASAPGQLPLDLVRVFWRQVGLRP